MRTQGKPNVGRAQDRVVEGEFEEVVNGGSNGGPLATVRGGGAMTQTRTQYTTAVAVQRPRDMGALAQRIYDEAALCGIDFYYSWTSKGSAIEGVSIDGAMILVRNFGNCAIDTRLAEEGPTHWIIEAVFVDLETGFTYPRLFRQRKGEAHQRGDGDRLLDIAFQIGQSKAQRNVIVKAMPPYIVARALAAAKEAAASKYKDLPQWVQKAKVAFGKLGVTIDELESKLGKPTEQWNANNIAYLVSIERAILGRETTVEAEFRTPAPPPEPAAAPAPDKPPSTPDASGGGFE